MKWIRQQLSRLLRALCASSLAILVVIVLLGILSKRNVVPNMPWTAESAEFLLSWVVMLGAALAYLENAHLGVDILTSKLTEEGRKVAYVFVGLVVFVFASWVMTWGGWQLFMQRYQMGQTMSSLPLLRAWFYLSLPISGGLIAIFAADNLRLLLTGHAGEVMPEPLEAVLEAADAQVSSEGSEP